MMMMSISALPVQMEVKPSEGKEIMSASVAEDSLLKDIATQKQRLTELRTARTAQQLQRGSFAADGKTEAARKEQRAMTTTVGISAKTQEVLPARRDGAQTKPNAAPAHSMPPASSSTAEKQQPQAAAAAPNASEDSNNVSFTSSFGELTPRPTLSNLRSNPGDTAAALARRCHQYQCRVEQGHLYQWCAEDKTKVSDAEHFGRCGIVAHALAAVALEHSALRVRFAELQRRWEAEHNVPPTRRLLSILGQRQQVKDSDRERATGMAEDDDVDLPEDVAIEMLAQYKQDRDQTEQRLREELAASLRECTRLKHEVRELKAANTSALAEDSDPSRFERHFAEEGRLRAALAEYRNELDKHIAHEQSWINALSESEAEIASLHERTQTILREREARENQILAACQEGEARAIQILQLDHAEAVSKMETQIEYLKKRKNFYKDKCTKLESLHEEWLTLRQKASSIEPSLNASSVPRSDRQQRLQEEAAAARKKRQSDELRRHVAELEQSLQSWKR